MRAFRIAADVGQIWRDKDPRSLSGNRHFKVVRLSRINDEPYAIMAPVYRNGNEWAQHYEGETRATRVSFRGLNQRWELLS